MKVIRVDEGTVGERAVAAVRARRLTVRTAGRPARVGWRAERTVESWAQK